MANQQTTTKTMHEEAIIAGFGGQGVMLAGKLLAQTGMKAGREVTYLPSYGAEVRGGTANCMVTVADEPIACPVVTDCDSLIVLNKASLNKFASRVRDGGLLVMNSSLIEGEQELSGEIEVLSIPANDIAIELGSARSVNMVAIGAYLQARGILSAEAAGACLCDVLAKRYHALLSVNIEALKRGARFVEEAR
jgi:2-oxoglutarate ferredoxin oxidoreductase subunit gamma